MKAIRIGTIEAVLQMVSPFSCALEKGEGVF
jgi:hypothetical protein